MKKKSKPKTKDFDKEFDAGRVTIDFSKAQRTEGLSQVIKLPPMTIPTWLNAEIEKLARLQANSKASVVRQLLVAAIEAKRRAA